jgi:hypothetical protein
LELSRAEQDWLAAKTRSTSTIYRDLRDRTVAVERGYGMPSRFGPFEKMSKISEIAVFWSQNAYPGGNRETTFSGPV